MFLNFLFQKERNAQNCFKDFIHQCVYVYGEHNMYNYFEHRKARDTMIYIIQ